MSVLKSNYIVQIIVGFISIIFSFYMYCIGKMERHKDITKEYDDSEFQSSVRYNMKIKEKNEQRKQKHEHCCFINTGMFAITSSASVILLKKRLDEFDKEYKSVSSNKEEFVSKN